MIEKQYQDIIDSTVEKYLSITKVKSVFSDLYIPKKRTEFSLAMPKNWDFEDPEINDNLDNFYESSKELLLDFGFEDSRMSGSMIIFCLENSKGRQIFVQQIEEYSYVIAGTKKKNILNVFPKVVQLYSLLKYKHIENYIGTIPTFIQVGFIASHSFMVDFLYKIFQKENLWSLLSNEKYIDIDYDYPRIKGLIKAVNDEAKTTRTFDLRRLTIQKYDYLEEKYSYGVKGLSFNNSDEELAYETKANKQKALLRYLKKSLIIF